MTSIFDLFKIGIGPSSSHTVGPMRAAKAFCETLAADRIEARIESVRVELFGSLALTGRGHGIDRAIMLGLSGELPERVDPDTVDAKLAPIRTTLTLALGGAHPVHFDPETDLIFRANETLPLHTNGMRFSAYGHGGRELRAQTFYSIGGGFILTEGGERSAEKALESVPFPFDSAAEMLRLGREHGKSIWEMVLANETVARPEREVREGVYNLWGVMQECAARGLSTEGVLPGGLGVRRRAPSLHQALLLKGSADPLSVVDWINVFALAIGEENAAGGRVVTAPTNGAAGVVPALAHYYLKFIEGADEEGLLRYFLSAGAIGILYKENASISGAEVGCQGEIGVACSMAAGGLVAALGGTDEQVEHAAEIGMEHNLGMTCDPIGGLVQIPCIERNAFGAVKAVNAARMAMHEVTGHKVSLDQVIRAMYETGRDMQSRYKETALAGLAINVAKC